VNLLTNFTLATPSQNQIWSNQFISEYVRASSYQPFMSTNADNIIGVKNELTNKKGELIHCPVFAKVRGTPNNGSTTLAGNEKSLSNYSVGFQTNLVRDAINIQITEELKTELDLRAIAGTQLKKFAAETLKNDLITAFNSVPVAMGGTAEDITVPYNIATTAQLNAYVTANSDRAYFVGGSNTGVMSSSLETVGASTGVLTGAILSQIKDMADATTNSSIFAIDPYETVDGNPWFVLFVNGVGFSQLRADPAIMTSTKDALPREHDADKNPLFTGGDLIWDGIVIKKIRDYTNLGGVGEASANVAQAQLCGLNSVLMGYSMKTRATIRKEDDYQLNAGVGFMEHRGQILSSVQGLTTGQVKIFHAS
jgi:hypothetical protein